MVIATDYPIGFRVRVGTVAAAGMGLYRPHQVVGAAVMEKEDALSQSPQGRGPKFIAGGYTLGDVVCQGRPHVMKQQVRIQVCLDVAERRGRRRSGRERLAMAEGATYLTKELAPVLG